MEYTHDSDTDMFQVRLSPSTSLLASGLGSQHPGGGHRIEGHWKGASEHSGQWTALQMRKQDVPAWAIDYITQQVTGRIKTQTQDDQQQEALWLQRLEG